MSIKLTKSERETIIIFNEADGFFDIETSVQSHIRKFDRLGYKCTSTQLYSDGTVQAKCYNVPKWAITFRKPAKRVMSDEQRAAARERLQGIRADL